MKKGYLNPTQTEGLGFYTSGATWVRQGWGGVFKGFVVGVFKVFGSYRIWYIVDY